MDIETLKAKKRECEGTVAKMVNEIMACFTNETGMGIIDCRLDVSVCLDCDGVVTTSVCSAEIRLDI